MFEFLRNRSRSQTGDDGFVAFVRAELARRSIADPSTIGDGSYRTVAVAGAAGSGKGSYVRILHERLGAVDKTPIVLALPKAALESGDEDLGMHLFFDASLGGELPTVRVVTVPGVAFRDAARLELFSRADAVIFLADAQPARLDANEEAYESLRSVGRDLPLVVGRTKADLPGALSVDGLTGVRALDVCPPSGKGVMDSFKAVIRAMLLPER